VILLLLPHPAPIKIIISIPVSFDDIDA